MSTPDSLANSRSKFTIGNSKELRFSSDKKSLDAEIYGLGRKIRHLQPPGGNESGIFDVFCLPPKELQIRGRKHLQPPGGKASGIFDAFILPPKELHNPGRKHLQPPGGKASGIFDAIRSTPPKEVYTLESKVKDHCQSQGFSSPSMSPPRQVTPLKLISQYKPFESPVSEYRVNKKESKTTKSSAFDVDDPITLPRHDIKKNTIAGLDVKEDAEKTGSRMKTRNPITFEGMGEIRLPCKSRQPHGGTSSILLG